MSTVRISFDYTPDEPDDDDATGVSNEEYERITDALMEQFGAENFEFKKADA